MIKRRYEDPRAKKISEDVLAIMVAMTEDHDVKQFIELRGQLLKKIEGMEPGKFDYDNRSGFDHELFNHRAAIATRIIEQSKDEERILHERQKALGISGIEWVKFGYGGRYSELPTQCSTLELLDSDKQILREHKLKAFDFIGYWKECFKVWWQSPDDGWVLSDWENLYNEYLQSDWVELNIDDEIIEAKAQDGEVFQTPIFGIDISCLYDDPSLNALVFRMDNSTPSIQ